MGTNNGTRLRLETSSIATTSRPLRAALKVACDERETFARSALPALWRSAASRDACGVLTTRRLLELSARLIRYGSRCARKRSIVSERHRLTVGHARSGSPAQSLTRV